MSRAVVLGGSGLIGRAVARRLLLAGWDVEITGRDLSRVPADLLSAGARFHPIDRDQAGALSGLIGSGADLLVDCLCFTAAGARQLLPVLGDVGSTVMLSSKAVYVDSAGRHVNSSSRPEFSGPIAEDQATVAPGNGFFDSPEGYGSNKVAAEHVLLDSGHPVTVVRASKVHGEGAFPAREWVFVRRVLDNRKAVFLVSAGAGVDHTTAAVNIAALVECVTRNPGTRILNSADPDAPSALDISLVVASYFGHEWEEVLLPGGGVSPRVDAGGAGPGSQEPESPELGAHPWDSAAPIVLDTRASLELGYVPVGDYAATVRDEIAWLSRTADDPRQKVLRSEFFSRYVDYSLEDQFLSNPGRTVLRAGR